MLRRLPFIGLLTGFGYWLWRFLSPQHSELILQDRVVIVTGASRGIGRALAMAFARRGARIVLTARDQAALEAVAREIEPYAPDSLVIPADLLDDDQRATIIPRTLEAFGQIDVLINNAGLSGGGLFQEADEARITRLLDLNLKAPLLLARQTLPHFLEQGHGYIVNVGSTAARVASPTFVAYSASKYGLAGFTDALRREIQGTGVHLLLALPGWVRTDMVPPALREQVEQRGFILEDPHDVAEAIVQGLVKGQEELVLGGPLVKFGVYTERYAPLLHRLYWRVMLTRGWIDATRHIP